MPFSLPEKIQYFLKFLQCYRAVDCAMILEPACGLLTSAGIESNGRRILEDPPVEFLQSIVQNRDLWCRVKQNYLIYIYL